MSIRSKLFLSAIAIAVTAGAAHAALVDTGSVPSGIDPSWTVQQFVGSNPGLLDSPNAYIAPYVANSFPFNYWGQPLLGSQWIVPTVDGPAVSLDPSTAGFYQYNSGLFSIGAGGGFFHGSFLTDNAVTQIFVTKLSPNPGTPTYIFNNSNGEGGFGNNVGTNFQYTFAPGAAGTYQLSFVVENFAQNGGNPSSLDVAFSTLNGVRDVPEPSTWAMMMLGFLSVGLLAYRRKPGFRMA